MYDYNNSLQAKIDFYNQPKFVNDPFHPAGFKGTFAFKEHTAIPDVFTGLLQRYFGHFRIRRIPLNKINDLLNEIWEGPGSLEKVFRLEDELRANGNKIAISASDIAKLKENDEEDDNESDIELEFNFEFDTDEEE